MTSRTNSSLPRPRTKSTSTSTATPLSPSSSSTAFRPTLPSALLASHNAKSRLVQPPSLSFSSAPSANTSPSNTTSTSSLSTERGSSSSARLRKPSPGVGKREKSREEVIPAKPLLQKQISAPLFRAGEPSSFRVGYGVQSEKRDEQRVPRIQPAGDSAPDGSGLGSPSTSAVAVGGVGRRTGSIKRKAAPGLDAEDEKLLSEKPPRSTQRGPEIATSSRLSITPASSSAAIPRPRTISGPGALPQPSSSTVLAGQTTTARSSVARQRVTSVIAPLSSNSSPTTSPPSMRKPTSRVTSTAISSATTTSSAPSPGTRLRTPSTPAKPNTSSSTPSTVASPPNTPPTVSSVSPKLPPKSPARSSSQLPTSPLRSGLIPPASPPTSSNPRTTRSAPSSVRRLSQLGVPSTSVKPATPATHSSVYTNTGANGSSFSSRPAPTSLPPGAQAPRVPGQSAPRPSVNVSATQPILRRPSLATLPSTSSTKSAPAAATATNPTPATSLATSPGIPQRRIRVPSLVSSTPSVTSPAPKPATGSSVTPANPTTAPFPRQRYTSLPQKPQEPSLPTAPPASVTSLRKPTSTPSMSTPASFARSQPPARNRGLLFPPLDSGEESSGSVYSQISVSGGEDGKVEVEDGMKREFGREEAREATDRKRTLETGVTIPNNTSSTSEDRPPRTHEDLRAAKTTVVSGTMQSGVREAARQASVASSSSTSQASPSSASTTPRTSSTSTPATTPSTSPPQLSSMLKTRAPHTTLPAISTVPLPTTGSVEASPRILPEGPPLRLLKSSFSDSSLRTPNGIKPMGPRSPVSPRSTTELAPTPTSLRPSPPKIESNQSFSSLISVYTSNNHGHTPSNASVASSTQSSDTRYSRYPAPAPGSIFGLGAFTGSERSTSDSGSKMQRKPIPSFADSLDTFGIGGSGSSATDESEVEAEVERPKRDKNEQRIMGEERKEKGLSSRTVRAGDRDGFSGMEDKDGRTVGDDPGGATEDGPSTPQAKKPLPSPWSPASSSNPNPSPGLSQRETSPIPPSASQNSRSIRRRASQGLAPLTISPHQLPQPRLSPNRNSPVPHMLGTENMKRLLSKPAIVSGYSSQSDSDRRPSSPVFTRAVPNSPRRRFASETNHPYAMEREKGYRSAPDATPKKSNIGASDWVPPWEVDGDTSVAGSTPPSDSRGLLGRSASLVRKSEDGEVRVKEKKPRNVLRKPSVKASSNEKLRAPGSGSSTRLPSPSPSPSRGGNSPSSRGSSPIPGVVVAPSPAIRSPAEEIKMAYKQQAARRDLLERNFNVQKPAQGRVAEERLDMRAETGTEGKQEKRARVSESTVAVTPSIVKEAPVPAATQTSAYKSEVAYSAVNQNGKADPGTPRTPRTPYTGIGPKTGTLVAIGREEDSFLPSFSSTPNFASQLVVENDPERPVKPPPDPRAARPSLQERRLSLKRPLAVIDDATNLRISLDRPPKAFIDGDFPSVSRTPRSATCTSPGVKGGKGGLWGLMKRISGGGLRDKYQVGDGECSPSTVPPPVPALPKGINAIILADTSAKTASASASWGSIPHTDIVSASGKTIRPRRSLGDTRPQVISNSTTGQSPSSASSTMGSASASNRRSTTTRSSSPVSSSFNRPGESRTSHSSYGDEKPPLPSARSPNTFSLQQHILSPSELSRLEINFEQEYEKRQRSQPTVTRPSLSSVPTSTSVETTSRSNASQDDWMIVATPADDNPPFSLPLPPHRKPRSSSPSAAQFPNKSPKLSRPGTAPGPAPLASKAVKNSRKTSMPAAPANYPTLFSSMSDDGHGTPQQQALPPGRKSTSSIPKPAGGKLPQQGVVFREGPRSRTLTEEEKAEKWDDLLLRSDMAGGTLQLRTTDRLESDALLGESDGER
ncbi:hypothetical protein V5O48_006599 [Marasmius crinis-equi]|uniref:Uncharacterized protein n=1 Tax=Marasmius crinis-equi TaxID=585013 RepID=A0ABR3FJX9_9AGAR